MTNIYEYEIFSNYGYGWDYTSTAESRKDATRLLKEYRENQSQYSHKIKRIKIN